MAKAKPETAISAAAATGVEDMTKTGVADAMQPGETLPATGTAGAAADVVGADAPVTDAGHATDFEASLRREQTVVVKGPEKGRWRAGRHFTIEPSSIPLVDLTEADLEKLCADPLLTVGIVEAPY